MKKKSFLYTRSFPSVLVCFLCVFTPTWVAATQEMEEPLEENKTFHTFFNGNLKENFSYDKKEKSVTFQAPQNITFEFEFEIKEQQWCFRADQRPSDIFLKEFEFENISCQPWEQCTTNPLKTSEKRVYSNRLAQHKSFYYPKEDFKLSRFNESLLIRSNDGKTLDEFPHKKYEVFQSKTMWSLRRTEHLHPLKHTHITHSKPLDSEHFPYPDEDPPFHFISWFKTSNLSEEDPAREVKWHFAPYKQNTLVYIQVDPKNEKLIDTQIKVFSLGTLKSF